MNSFKDVIAIWPKRTEFAAAVGIKPALASLWWQRDVIQPEKYNAVVKAALAAGHPEVTLELLATFAEKKFSEEGDAA